MKQSNKTLRRTLTAATIAVLAIAIGAVFGTAGNGSAASKAAPVEQSPPTINGGNQEGKTLTANPGKWQSSSTVNYKYQWRRCDASGGNCAGISGANAKLYDVKAQDVGHTIRVHVTATNADGSTSDTSAPTAVIKPATAPPPAPAPTGCPSGAGVINISDLSLPARLVLDGFNSTPSTLGRNVGTLSMRVHVSACGGRSVSGALVYAAAVPYNQFSVAPEAQTGSDGWATINETQLSGYPASSKQGLLAVFLRARKSGEPKLGGVSTRRLVSFNVNLG